MDYSSDLVDQFNKLFGGLRAEWIEEHDMLNWVKVNRKVLNAGMMRLMK